MKVWMDGNIVDGAEATVSITDHGLLYGDGIFEGIRVRAGRIFRLEQHLDRLQQGATSICLTLPRTRDEIGALVRDTVIALGETESYIRLIVTRGEGPLGVDPLTCHEPRIFCICDRIALFADDQRERGLDMITSSLRRPGADVLDPCVKSLNYLNPVLAKLEAKQRGADEALLLNARATIAEAAVGNVFLIHGRRLSTPPTSDGCLDGINRRAVLELAASLDLDAEVRSLTRADVFSADEMLMTGSGAGVVAIRSLDDRPIGDGARGPFTAKIEQAHRRLAETEGTSVFDAA